MNQKNILIAVGAFFVGVLTSGIIASYAVNGKHTSVMNMYAMHHLNDEDKLGSSASSMSMDDMTSDLKNKYGDEFDKAFIAEMIVHHQGAIDMAILAKANAKHQEIKDLANNIITAQTSEINEMKTWQTQWDYSSNNSMMNGHGMMGM